MLLESFAAYGMTVDGVFFPLRMWERITSVNDGGYWPTPRATMGALFQPSADKERKGGGKPKRLEVEVGRTIHGIKGKERPTLTGIAKMWPTPTTQDSKNNGAKSQMERNTKPLNAEVGGSLNPTWVEWLMGYPPEWTALEDWATLWFRPKRAKPSKG